MSQTDPQLPASSADPEPSRTILAQMVRNQCPSAGPDEHGAMIFRFDLCCDGRMNVRAIAADDGAVEILGGWFETASALAEERSLMSPAAGERNTAQPAPGVPCADIDTTTPAGRAALTSERSPS